MINPRLSKASQVLAVIDRGGGALSQPSNATRFHCSRMALFYNGLQTTIFILLLVVFSPGKPYASNGSDAEQVVHQRTGVGSSLVLQW